MSKSDTTPAKTGSETNPMPSQANGESITTKPIAAGSTAGLEPEFLRTDQVHTILPVSRGTLYNLAAAGKIRGVLLRATGKKSGVRIWSVESIRAYIRSQMAAGEGEVAA